MDPYELLKTQRLDLKNKILVAFERRLQIKTFGLL